MKLLIFGHFYLPNLYLSDTIVLNWRQFYPHPKKRFWLLQMGGGERGCYWHLCVEARDAAKYPVMHKTAPTARNYLAPMSVVPRLRNSTLILTYDSSMRQELLCPFYR